MLHQQAGGITELAFGAGVVAALVALTSVWGLMRYFRIRDFQALNPFAYYCFALGLSALCFLGFIGA